MMTPEIKNKIECRKRLKSLLNSHYVKNNDEHLVKNLNVLLNSHFKNFPETDFMIGVFAPIEYEPNLLEHIESWDNRLCFPFFVKESEMTFKTSKIENLVAGKDFGREILSPSQESENVLPQIILVPGLGFTERGERMGRGRGFYDRYLNNFNGLIIGLGFELQIEKQLPTEEHDVKMNFVVTEKRVIDCKANK